MGLEPATLGRGDFGGWRKNLLPMSDL